PHRAGIHPQLEPVVGRVNRAADDSDAADHARGQLMVDTALTSVDRSVPDLPPPGRTLTIEQQHARGRSTIGTRSVVYMLASLPVLWLLGGERLLSPIVITAAAAVLALGYRPARRGVPAAMA